MDRYPLMTSQQGVPAVSPSKNSQCQQPKKSEEDKAATADVDIPLGMYTSVLLAAFGQVSIRLGHEERHTAKVHPFLLFLCCIPLYVVQTSVLTALVLNVDWKVRVGLSDHPNVLQPIQMMMIIVAQLMGFRYLVNSARLIVFVLNPITWLEIKHPNKLQWVPKSYRETKCAIIAANLVRPMVFAPWAISALIMKFTVGYLICTLSVSIILSGLTVQDAIFNSLALTFLADLAGPWWHFLHTTFQLETKDAEEDSATFSFFLDSGVWKEGSSTLSEYGKKKANVLAACVQQAVLYLPFLTRAGGAANMEDLVPFIVIFMVYTKVIFMTAQAFDTTVLPTVRDVCTMWRWQNHQGGLSSVVPPIVVFFEDHFNPVAVRNKTELLHFKMSSNLTDPCEPGGKYYTLGASEAHTLFCKYPLHIWASLFLVVFALLGHRISSWIFSKVLREEDNGEDAEGDEDEEEEEDEETEEETEDVEEGKIKRG